MTSWFRAFISRLIALFRRKDLEKKLQEELDFHLEMQAAENLKNGMNPPEARNAALRSFGGIDQTKEKYRDAGYLRFVEDLLQDLRYGMRMLRRNPGFSAAILITLILGIGANTAIFHILDTVDLRPLPVRNPEELVLLKPLQDGSNIPVLSYPIIREMNEKQNVVQGIFAAGDLDVLAADIDERTIIEPVDGRLATGNYFKLLGANARLGRILTEADDRPSAAGVAVIGDRFWRREFGGGADVIGKSITINGALLRIVGVMPPEFFGETIGKVPDLWVPMNLAAQLMMKESLSPAVGWLKPMARLRPDVPRPAAQAALSALYDELHHLTLSIKGATDFHMELDPIGRGQNRLEEFSKPLRLLMATAGFVILIACFNLASLFLARSAARTHEIGVRMAIGASRSRLVRQLMTESLLLSAVGGVIGFTVGIWGSRVLAALATAGQPLRLSMNPDWRVAIFTALVTIVAACLFGLAPALSSAGMQLNTALQVNSRVLKGGFEHRRAKLFVVAQLSISLILIAGASLLVRSFWNVLYQDWGYQKNSMLVLNLAFDIPTIRASFSPVFQEALLQHLNSLHGIRSAAVASEGPLRGVEQPGEVSLPDRPSMALDQFYYSRVSPRFFETLDIDIIAGRPIMDEDISQSQPVAVISETAAKKLFGPEDPIGKFASSDKVFRAESAFQIVGVSHDLHLADPHMPFSPVIFRPIFQNPHYSTTPLWYIRIDGHPAQVMPEIRSAVRQVDPNVTVESIDPWSELVLSKIRTERMLAWIAGGFGILSLVLSCVGVFGLVSFGMQRRTREIGIRLVLGATPGRVMSFLLREAMLLMIAGIAIGGVATLVLTRLIGSVLFGLTPHDPAMLISSFFLLSGAVIVGAYLPARRAAQLNLIKSLRQE